MDEAVEKAAAAISDVLAERSVTLDTMDLAVPHLARAAVVAFLKAWEPQREMIRFPVGERFFAPDRQTIEAARAEADRLEREDG